MDLKCPATRAAPDVAIALARELSSAPSNDIVNEMRTISVLVDEQDYEAFRSAAKARRASIAQLIREAMAEYRATRLASGRRLKEVPVLTGHRPLGPLPERGELWDEVFEP